MRVKTIVENKIPMIEVTNALGLRVVFCKIGASIYAIYLNNELMTLTPKTFVDFANKDIYYGKTIGGIANRVKNGQVDINGQEYQLLLNEGENALHGGVNGLSRCIFSSKVNIGKSFFSVIFTFKKKKMFDGLPGKVTYYISYGMTDQSNDLIIDFKAISDNDTIVALTNHTYFTLGDEDISKLHLQIPASRYVEPNRLDLVPEEEKEVTRVLDFRKKKLLVKDLEDKSIQDSKTLGYDHHFIFDSNDQPIILENKRFHLEITTDFTGCQIYTDNYADGIQMKNTTMLNHRGVAIEPQDSPLERKVLQKRQTYHRHIIYSFRKV